MKRDFNLIRNILIDVEEAEPGKVIQGVTCESVDEWIVAEHVKLLVDTGFLEGQMPNHATLRLNGLANRVCRCSSPGGRSSLRSNPKGRSSLRSSLERRSFVVVFRSQARY